MGSKFSSRLSIVGLSLFAISCTTTTPTSPAEELRAPAAFGEASEGTCSYTPLCPDGRSAEWAQQRVSGDLMMRYLESLKLPNTVKVAVVDTGFDIKGNKDTMLNSNPRVSKVDQELGDVTRDEVGHGTAVSGLVGAKNPIGLAPNLYMTSYRVVKADTTGGTDSKYLNNAIAKACADGHEIINLSWGNAIDENDIVSAEKSYAELMKTTEAKGCLLVVAAGNASVRIERKDINPDDNYLRVEAIAPSGERAYFTSNGEVSAPGQGVFTLRSTNVEKAPAPEALCGTRTGQFINGTSFAAPITAALAGQVLNVYKSSPRFNNMLPVERIRLVTRTLTASQKVLGHVDGYLAVRIADAWRRSTAGLLTVDELFAFLKSERQALCSSPYRGCRNQWQCDAKVKCVDEARRRLALCGTADRSDMVKDLLKTGYEMGAFELTLQAMRVAAEAGATNSDTEYARKQIARRTWDYQYKIWSNKYKSYSGVPYPDSAQRAMSFDIAAGLLPHLSMRGYVGESSDADKAISLFLTSNGFSSRLSALEKNGSKEDLELVRNVLDKAQTSLGSGEALKILRNSASQAVALAKTDFNMSLAWFRLLERLQNDPKFKEWDSALNSLQLNFAKLFVELKVKDNVPNSQILKLLKPFLDKQSSLFANLRENVLNGKASPEQLSSYYAFAILGDSALSGKQRVGMIFAAIDTWVSMYSEDQKDPMPLAALESLMSLLVNMADYTFRAQEPALTAQISQKLWGLGRTQKPSFSLRVMSLNAVPFYKVSDLYGTDKANNEAIEILKEFEKMNNEAFVKSSYLSQAILNTYQGKIVASDAGALQVAKVLAKYINYLVSQREDTELSRYRAAVMAEAVLRIISNEEVQKALSKQAVALASLADFRSQLNQEKVIGLKGTSYARKQLLERIGKVLP